MDSSNIGYQKWAIALYLFATSLKGVSSMKLHRHLGITQKAAWFMAHRIREAWGNSGNPFSGPVEVDETYIGGKRKNMHGKQRTALTGRGTAGKTVVAGARDRASINVSANTGENTDRFSLQLFVAENAAAGVEVFTDDHAAYVGMPFRHKAIQHAARE